MKIAVLGYAGSGKTYLSDYIAKMKNIPVLHLDNIKWDKEWKPIDDSVVCPRLQILWHSKIGLLTATIHI